MSGDAIYAIIWDHLPHEAGKDIQEDENRIFRGIIRAAVDLMQWVGRGPNPIQVPRATVLQWITESTADDAGLLRALNVAKVQGPVDQHTIDTIFSVLRLVRRMGDDNRAHLPPRILSLAGGQTLLFISPNDHYVYPLKINGVTTDLRAYRHSYPQLMSDAASDAGTQVAALTSGIASPALICAAIANWVAESDRNWCQLPLTLAANAGGVATTELYNDGKNWPMGPGSWKQLTWGPGQNPQSEAPGDTPKDVKRLMCRMALRFLFTKQWWIQHLGGGPANVPLSQKFLENSVAATLLATAKSQANKLYLQDL